MVYGQIAFSWTIFLGLSAQMLAFHRLTVSGLREVGLISFSNYNFRLLNSIARRNLLKRFWLVCFILQFHLLLIQRPQILKELFHESSITQITRQCSTRSNLS